MNKKGMTEAQVLYFIILFAGAVVLFLFAAKLKASSEKGTIGVDCSISMTINTNTKFESAVYAYQGIDEFCPVYNMKISEKKVEFTGKNKTKTLEKYKELTADKVNTLIAEEMRRCWWQFGAGKLAAFWLSEDLLDAIGSSIPNDAIGCRVCTTIEFDLPEKKEFTGLKDYMKTHTVSKKMTETSKELKLYAYIAEHEDSCGDYIGQDNCWEQFARDDRIRINTDLMIESNKKYSVVLIREGLTKDKFKSPLNVYVIDEDTAKAVCTRSLPFR